MTSISPDTYDILGRSCPPLSIIIHTTRQPGNFDTEGQSFLSRGALAGRRPDSTADAGSGAQTAATRRNPGRKTKKKKKTEEQKRAVIGSNQVCPETINPK